MALEESAESCKKADTVLQLCAIGCLFVQFMVEELQAYATKTVVDYYDSLQCRYHQWHTGNSVLY